MRCAWPLSGIVAGLVVLTTGCDTLIEETAGGNGGQGGEEEAGPSGLALLYRGYGGGDPEQEQALVFHDPETGEETAAVELPEGAVDPMAPDIPVYSLFSADWRHFAYSSPESDAVELAALDEEGSRYEAAATLDPPAGQEWGDPRISDDRLWFAAEDAGEGRGGVQVLSVPLDEPTGSPNQEGTLPLGENGRPSDWEVDPDGGLYVREQQQTEQVDGGGDLVVRRSGDNVMNATLTADGGRWQDLAASPVWGGGTTVVGPVDPNGEVAEDQDGAHLVMLDENGQGFKNTQLLGGGDGPVLQYAPAPGRDGLLLQSTSGWHRVDIGDDGVGEAEELFPVPRDASMDGYPLAVRWSAPAEAADQESPPE